MDLHFIIQKLAVPVISVLLLSLCIPYVIAAGIVPVMGASNYVLTKKSLVVVRFI